MSHDADTPQSADHAESYKTRLGVWMFCLYAAIYGGFVAINVVKPVLMEARVICGLNLAVVYGMGLIVCALVLAIVYNRMCNARETAVNESADREVHV